MPQVFGSDKLGLLGKAWLWIEAASESDIEKATHSGVADEARARGLVPLRMSGSGDPIWHHPETGKIIGLTPAHSGENANYTSIANTVARLKRLYPTAEETARASRPPEDVEAEQSAAAEATRSKKQDQVAAAKRARDRADAESRRVRAQADAILFKKEHGPFQNANEVQTAFDARSEKARVGRPNDTVDQFAERLRALPLAARQQVHKTVFPERYA